MILLIMDVSVLNLFLITKKGIRKVNKGMHEERFETAEKVVKKSSSMGKIRGVFVVTGRNVIVATHSLKLILVDTHKHYRFYLTLWRRILHEEIYINNPHSPGIHHSHFIHSIPPVWKWKFSRIICHEV